MRSPARAGQRRPGRCRRSAGGRCPGRAAMRAAVEHALDLGPAARPSCRRAGAASPARRGSPASRRAPVEVAPASVAQPSRVQHAGARRSRRVRSRRRAPACRRPRATNASSWRSTSGSGSWPGSCRTTGTKPPTACKPMRRKGFGLVLRARRAGSRPARTRWRGRRAAAISASTRSAAELVAPPGDLADAPGDRRRGDAVEQAHRRTSSIRTGRCSRREQLAGLGDVERLERVGDGAGRGTGAAAPRR